MSTTLKSTMQLSQFQTLLSKTLYWGGTTISSFDTLIGCRTKSRQCAYR